LPHVCLGSLFCHMFVFVPFYVAKKGNQDKHVAKKGTKTNMWQKKEQRQTCGKNMFVFVPLFATCLSLFPFLPHVCLCSFFCHMFVLVPFFATCFSWFPFLPHVCLGSLFYHMFIDYNYCFGSTTFFPLNILFCRI
jgi:hypothetical protein